MNNSQRIICSLALLSPLAYAQITTTQPETNVAYTVAVTVLFLIAIGVYHVTKTKIRQIKPELPSLIHHIIGFVIAFIFFYALFFLIGFCF